VSGIRHLVDQIVADGVLSAEELKEFVSAVVEDKEIDAEECKQIERIFGLISEGKLKVEGK
jgi:polyhydroxyalkanoate synthesis regulator phasin